MIGGKEGQWMLKCKFCPDMTAKWPASDQGIEKFKRHADRKHNGITRYELIEVLE